MARHYLGPHPSDHAAVAGLSQRLTAQRKYRLMDLAVRIGSARDVGDTETVEKLRAEREALRAEMGIA